MLAVCFQIGAACVVCALSGEISCVKSKAGWQDSFGQIRKKPAKLFPIFMLS